MRLGRFPLSAAVLAVILTAGPAAAQTPMDDPLDARDAKRVDRMEQVVRELRGIVFQLRDTGKPVVVQPADTDARIQDLAARLDDLEQTLRRLNGSLETATHQADLGRKDVADLKAQLEALAQRLAALEAKVAAPPPAAEAAPPAADPGAAFAQARQLMQAGDYDAAEAAFADYVKANPDGARTSEARYWWGKTLTARGAHADAAAAYIAAIRGWPRTSWAPDALVELSRSLIALKQPKDACQTLAEFTRRYPKAPANVAARAAGLRTQAKCD